MSPKRKVDSSPKTPSKKNKPPQSEKHYPVPDDSPVAPLPDSGTLEDYSFPRVTISRGDDVAIEIELCLGDITETPSRVILLGQVQGLDPSRAAISLDEAMSGGLFRLLAQRSQSRGTGDLDIIPTGRHPTMAELIAFLSLGRWELFNESTLESAACAGLRSLLASSFDEFSTILMGGIAPGQAEIDITFSLRHMLRGFIQALKEDPERDRFRRIVIVECEIARIREMHRVLQVLVQGKDFDGVRTTLCSSRLPVRVRPEARIRRAQAALAKSNLLNLSMRPSLEVKGASEIIAMLQPGKDKSAVILRKTGEIGPDAIPKIYDAAGVSTERGVRTKTQLSSVSKLVTTLLPAEILAPLEKETEPRLELVHDAEASRVPWETLALEDGRHPALGGGFSRRFISENARSLWATAPASRLRLLMVINPTSDLPGAAKEGEALLEQLNSRNIAEIEYLSGDDATFERFTELLNTRTFDILHYAGHSAFNRENLKSSGLILANGRYFTGSDALGLARFPPVVVFNSCEAARIRRIDPVLKSTTKVSDSMRKKIDDRDAAHGAISIAEAFLIAGVHHYIGTFWPVDDNAATLFGATLYSQLAAGKEAGLSVTKARQALDEAGMPDWANYIHYGQPDAVIFPTASTAQP